MGGTIWKMYGCKFQFKVFAQDFIFMKSLPIKIKVVPTLTVRASNTVFYSNLPNLSEIFKFFNLRNVKSKHKRWKPMHCK